jgi:hypothetical protein
VVLNLLWCLVGTYKIHLTLPALAIGEVHVRQAIISKQVLACYSQLITNTIIFLYYLTLIIWQLWGANRLIGATVTVTTAFFYCFFFSLTILTLLIELKLLLFNTILLELYIRKLWGHMTTLYIGNELQSTRPKYSTNYAGVVPISMFGPFGEQNKCCNIKVL